MTRKGFESIDELRGMLSVPADADQAAYERAGYVSCDASGQRGRLRPLVGTGSRTSDSFGGVSVAVVAALREE